MSRCAALLLALLVCGCGSPTGPRWKTSLRSPDGRPVHLMTTARVILFLPDELPRNISGELALGMQGARLDVPALTSGYYELWQAGLRPLRIDGEPPSRVEVEIGYPLDVELDPALELPADRTLQVQATWRGQGRHPEALLRTRFDAAAPPLGERSSAWVDFVKGISLSPGQPGARLYVPWPGHYRITWSTGTMRISEGPGYVSGSYAGEGMGDQAVAVDIPESGDVPRLVIPR